MASETNGVAYDSFARTADRDPMDRVLAMDGRSSSTSLIAGCLLALIFHGALAAQALTISVELHQWSFRVRDRVAAKLQDLYDVELAKPPEPPPPPPEEKVEEKPTPAPPPPKSEAPPPPPPPEAQAGKVMTQEPDPDAPVDFTGGFTQGTGDTYAGGATSAAGKGKVPGERGGMEGGKPGGTGTAPAPPAPTVDRSRQAGLLGSTDWNCSSFWPAEADGEQIDQALVTIAVTVGPDGKAVKVDVIKDPGHGFGLAARRCAMRESFQTGLDAAGTAITTQTKPFRVRFER